MASYIHVGDEMNEIVKFTLAVFVAAIVVEIVDNFDNSAAWVLVVIIILGILLNQPYAVTRIQSFFANIERVY